MPSTQVEQTTHLKIIAGTVAHVINSFMVERRSRRLSEHSIRFYEVELGLFSKWLDRQGVISLDELTADVIRLYLMALSGTRNAGGQHASYRAIRALLTWVCDELDIETRNPITRVKVPKVVKNSIEGVNLTTVQALERTYNVIMVEWVEMTRTYSTLAGALTDITGQEVNPNELPNLILDATKGSHNTKK